MARSTSAKSRGMAPSQRAEWLIGAACGAVTLALISILLFEAIAGAREAPELRIVPQPARQVADHYVIDLRVVNDGRVTAADVVIEGQLGAGSETEVSSVTLDYVPPGPGVRAALVFGTDPAGTQLVLTVRGYTRP